jgi:hypothetical protein
MSLYSFPQSYRAPACYWEGLEEDEAVEMQELVEGLYRRFEAPEFILKPAAYDAMALAKRDKDLEALRLYDRLMIIGIHPKEVKHAVTTSKKIAGGFPEMQIANVKSHTAVQVEVMSEVTYSVWMQIKVLALLFPAQSDLIIELVKERGVKDVEQIRSVLEQSTGTATPLLSGTI